MDDFREWLVMEEDLYHRRYNPKGTKFIKPNTRDYSVLNQIHDFTLDNQNEKNAAAYLENVRRVVLKFMGRCRNLAARIDPPEEVESPGGAEPDYSGFRQTNMYRPVADQEGVYALDSLSFTLSSANQQIKVMMPTVVKEGMFSPQALDRLVRMIWSVRNISSNMYRFNIAREHPVIKLSEEVDRFFTMVLKNLSMYFNLGQSYPDTAKSVEGEV